MTGSRKILCALALLGALLPAAAPAAAEAAAGRAGSSSRGQRLQHADLAQAGRKLVVSVRTLVPVALAKLQPLPDPRRASSAYLCLELERDPSSGPIRYCLGGRRAHQRLGWEQVDPLGRPEEKRRVRAVVRRPSPDELVVSVVPRESGLSPGRYRWRVIASRGCQPGGSCRQALPPQGYSAFRLRPVRAVGCTGGGAGLVTSGPRDRKVVALTFDDGPSDYTPRFLRVLREKGVPATFFEVGQEMPGREEVMRQILAEGDELGDHTMNHVEFPGYAQIAGAAARIRAYTHFQPCLFRPPGGGVDPAVVSTAGSLGMLTVNWDVDPRDWSLPGEAAIYSNVVSNAGPGSIVLMHDGGGPREETLAALPRVIDALRARGYRFATVTELLGDRILYRPYG